YPRHRSQAECLEAFVLDREQDQLFAGLEILEHDRAGWQAPAQTVEQRRGLRVRAADAQRHDVGPTRRLEAALEPKQLGLTRGYLLSKALPRGGLDTFAEARIQPDELITQLAHALEDLRVGGAELLRVDALAGFIDGGREAFGERSRLRALCMLECLGY